jgi:hypothetical protein
MEGRSEVSPKTPDTDFLGVIKAEGERETPIGFESTRRNNLICSRTDQSQYPGEKRSVEPYPKT